MERVVQPWLRLPRVVVETPSLKESKRHVDMTLRDVIYSGLGSAGDNWML